MVEHPVHTRVVICSSQIAATIRPVGQAVKTPPFHGGNMGSIPVRVTKKEVTRMCDLFFGDPYIGENTSFEGKHFAIVRWRATHCVAYFHRR